MMAATVAIAVILAGTLLTTRAIIAEPLAWRRPIVLAMGMCLTILALIGVIATGACK